MNELTSIDIHWYVQHGWTVNDGIRSTKEKGMFDIITRNEDYYPNLPSRYTGWELIGSPADIILYRPTKECS